MTIELKSFFQIALLSILGLAFYYANVFLGFASVSIVAKCIAVVILLLTLPLPIIALHHKNTFKGMNKGAKGIIVLGSFGLLFHHTIMTFILVMFAGGGASF